MSQYIDLHIHTTASDGSFTPEEVVAYAKKIGLTAIAIADHDSTDAVEPAIAAGKKKDIEVVPAIELSSESAEPNTPELHFLGYWIDCNNQLLQNHLVFFRESRKKRAFQMIEHFKKCNIHLEVDELLNIAETRSIGRLHFAQALLKQKFIYNIHEAFDKYLGYGKPAYVPKAVLPAHDAIHLIKQAGGIVVLAHPLYGIENNFELIRQLKTLGLDGIEVYHPKHSASITKTFEEQSEIIGLLKTGGSDCHGGVNGSDPVIGSIKVPYTVLDKLKEYINLPH